MRLATAFLVVIFLFSNVSAAQPQKNAVEARKTNPPLNEAPKATQTEAQDNYVERINSGAKKATDLGRQGLDKINTIQKQTTVLRQTRPHNIMGSYSGVSTWIPSKFGLSYTYSPSVAGSWELAYSRGSVAAPFFLDDIGSITESQISVLYRSYSRRNSFSFIYGLNYYNFDARLNGEYLSSVSGDPSDFNILRVRSIGVTLGLGNRWQLKNGVSLGVDWFHLNIPVNVFDTDADYLNSDADPEDKEDVRDAVDFLKRVPTFSFLKLQVGYTF